MRCEQVTEQIDDFLDGEIDAGSRAALTAHIEECNNCRETVAGAAALKNQLAHFGKITRPTPSAKFFDRALARAAREGGRRQRTRWVMTGFGGAIAATLMIWVVSSVFFASPNIDEAAIPSVTMALEAPKTFNLVFSSAAALSEASMTVTLPDGIELKGFAGQKEISWMTSLKKGRNVLPLTLIATSPVGGELLATLQHDDDDKTFRLQVSVI